jgi:hypothetical protein
MLKKARLLTRLTPASEEARRYKPHFVWPFAIAIDLGEQKSSSRYPEL